MFKKILIKYYYKKANNYLYNYNNKKAIYYLDKILKIDENNIEALLLKGTCHSNLLEKNESIECFDKCFKINK